MVILFLLLIFFFLILLLPPRSTLTDTLFPYTTLFLSHAQQLCRSSGAGRSAEVGRQLRQEHKVVSTAWNQWAEEILARPLRLDLGEDRKSTRLNSSH